MLFHIYIPTSTFINGSSVYATVGRIFQGNGRHLKAADVSIHIVIPSRAWRHLAKNMESHVAPNMGRSGGRCSLPSVSRPMPEQTGHPEHAKYDSQDARTHAHQSD